jgi:hypothetical protein
MSCTESQRINLENMCSCFSYCYGSKEQRSVSLQSAAVPLLSQHVHCLFVLLKMEESDFKKQVQRYAMKCDEDNFL